jgi:hypothetical protein
MKNALIVCVAIIGLVGLISISAPASYPTLTGLSITGGGATLTVANSGSNIGSLEVDYGADRYLLGSGFGYNSNGALAAHFWNWYSSYDSSWTTTVVKTGSTITVTGSCPTFTLTRSIYWNGDKFTMNDTVQNKTASNIAFPTNYDTFMTSSVTTNKSYLAGLPFDYNNYYYTHEVDGAAPNPSVFMQQAHSSLGLLVEDDVYRQGVYFTQIMDNTAVGCYNQSVLQNYTLGIPANGSYTIRFSLYPGGAGHDYWKFINTVRKDWGVNYTCYGPYTLSDQYYYVTGRSYNTCFLQPWFRDQDGGGVPDSVFAAQQQSYVSQAITDIAADPNALCRNPRFTCKIETFSTAINKMGITNGSTLPGGGPPSLYFLQPFTAAQTSTVEANASCAQWQWSTLWTDTTRTRMVVGNASTPCSLSVDQNASDYFEMIVYPGAGPSAWKQYGTNWQSYPSNGSGWNYQTTYLKSQMDYTLDYALSNVPANCSKAVYLDSFTINPDWYDNLSSYPSYTWNDCWDGGQWDGYTVTLNGGLIGQYWTDAVLVGIPARAYLLNYALNVRHVPIITNGHPVDAETRGFPSENFAETYFDALNDITSLKTLLSTGEPWGVQSMAMGHLSAPLSLGVWVSDSLFNTVGTVDSNYVTSHYAQVQNKYLIMCLRNGQLMEPYVNYVPPVGQAGGGGYGIMNLMYPITPVELHEGYIIGKEKIITAVSDTFYWNKSDHPAAPSVCKTFDTYGIANTPKGFSVTSVGAQWKVTIKLQSDWNGTAIVY